MSTGDATPNPAPAGTGPDGRPVKFCDLVMKGGVTSGIVYPKAVSVLKDTYTFKNIGGTSAGAMAAAATAAAEYGRQHGHDGGFKELDGLAEWLAEVDPSNEHTRLFNLFQPTDRTRPLYDVLTAATGPTRGKPARIASALVRSFGPWTFLGALPGLALALLAFRETTTPSAVVLLFLAAILSTLGAAVMVAVAFVLRVGRVLPASGFGLCPGYAPPKPGRPLALANWLAAYLNRLAGKPDDGDPLTFGDLWGTPDPKADHAIDLAMMTTNLTHGRPYRLPDLTASFFFDPTELEGYFPKHVVQWMVEHPRKSKNDPDRFAPLRPMPDPADMPVVVAARMSLALPVVIGAVPLHAVDFGRQPYFKRMNKELLPERCWFSDGGICSNFPVHFFDGYLPRWPTFGINLKPFDPDDDEKTNDCWMPNDNGGGVTAIWNRFDQKGGLKSVGGFVWAIINAARDWSDSALLPLPGYRDRVVHVSLDEATEGGMNLDMTADVIDALAARGSKAGEMLVRRFARPTPDDVLTWDNHRWVRFRSLMALFEDMIEDLEFALGHPEPGDRTYADLAARGPDDPPPGYPWGGARQREFAKQQLDRLNQLIGEWLKKETAECQFRVGKVPHPRPALRTVPDL